VGADFCHLLVIHLDSVGLDNADTIIVPHIVIPNRDVGLLTFPAPIHHREIVLLIVLAGIIEGLLDSLENLLCALLVLVVHIRVFIGYTTLYCNIRAKVRGYIKKSPGYGLTKRGAGVAVGWKCARMPMPTPLI
jgi:hypothetical protein